MKFHFAHPLSHALSLSLCLLSVSLTAEFPISNFSYLRLQIVKCFFVSGVEGDCAQTKTTVIL